MASNRPEYPKHKFDFGKDEFNALICGLVENFNTFHNTTASISPNAKHIIRTIQRYARFHEENGEEFVTVNFYDAEASIMTWQFVAFIFALHNAELKTDYFTQIKTKTMEELEE